MRPLACAHDGKRYRGRQIAGVVDNCPCHGRPGVLAAYPDDGEEALAEVAPVDLSRPPPPPPTSGAAPVEYERFERLAFRVEGLAQGHATTIETITGIRGLFPAIHSRLDKLEEDVGDVLRARLDKLEASLAELHDRLDAPEVMLGHDVIAPGTEG